MTNLPLSCVDFAHSGCLRGKFSTPPGGKLSELLSRRGPRPNMPGGHPPAPPPAPHEDRLQICYSKHGRLGTGEWVVHKVVRLWVSSLEWREPTTSPDHGNPHPIHRRPKQLLTCGRTQTWPKSSNVVRSCRAATLLSMASTRPRSW